MISDEIYEKCIVVLKDEKVDEEDKTERIEDLLKEEASLEGKQLENAVLDTLWRFRESGTNSSSPRPSRHTVVRRTSPAPWQTNLPTPISSSPRLTPTSTLSATATGFTRGLSSAVSPFPSPRPSPRLAFVSTQNARCPSYTAQDFHDIGSSPDNIADYCNDSADWQVNDEQGSNASSSYLSDEGFRSGLADYTQTSMNDMSPFDMLRSILRDERSNEVIEKALEAHNYDLSATILSLMNESNNNLQQASSIFQEQSKRVTIGHSSSPNFRPATPVGQAKSSIMCKYWLSTGNCARADCRFSHDPSKTVCKYVYRNFEFYLYFGFLIRELYRYWLLSNCLAGETCIFLHDNSALLANMMLERNSTPPTQIAQPNVELQDYSAFPMLQTPVSQPWNSPMKNGISTRTSGSALLTPPSTFSTQSFIGSDVSSHATSRPSSHHQSRSLTPFLPSADDSEAFPTLGSGGPIKGSKKSHSRRDGPVNGPKEITYSLADIVRKSPSLSPIQPCKTAKTNKAQSKSRENRALAEAIPPPEHIPWLETGNDVNNAYLKARQEALKHGGLRNKFLQRYIVSGVEMKDLAHVLTRTNIVLLRHGTGTILVRRRR